MSDKPAPRFRKTKTDKWAVMAPVENLEKALAEGGKIDVLKRSGDWSTFTVASLGKPFDVDGVQMCYGYGPDDEDDAQPSTSASSSTNGGGRSGHAGRSGQAGSPHSPADGGSSRSSQPGRVTPSVTDAAPPPRDPSEPLPEYQGGPDDEWDGYM